MLERERFPILSICVLQRIIRPCPAPFPELTIGQLCLPSDENAHRRDRHTDVLGANGHLLERITFVAATSKWFWGSSRCSVSAPTGCVLGMHMYAPCT